MTTRLPLVLGADGSPQQLQPSDTLSTSGLATTATTAISIPVGGAVIKGGQQATASAGTVTITFAAPFPTACVSAVGTVYVSGAAATTAYTATLTAFSKTGLTFSVSSDTGSGLSAATAAASGTLHWQAIGY